MNFYQIERIQFACLPFILFFINDNDNNDTLISVIFVMNLKYFLHYIRAMQ